MNENKDLTGCAFSVDGHCWLPCNECWAWKTTRKTFDSHDCALRRERFNLTIMTLREAQLRDLRANNRLGK